MTDLDAILDACKGLRAADIAERLAGEDVDALSRAMVSRLGEFTTIPRLPTLPYSMRFAMYGDDDVADWLLRYDEQGEYHVDPARDDDSPDGFLRWEHWEDAIRLLNRDTQLLSLVNTGRVALIDTTAAVVRAWYGALRLPGDDANERASGILLAVRDANIRGGVKEAIAYVERHGFENVLTACAESRASWIYEAGMGEPFAGKALRYDIRGNEPMAAEVRFPADGSRPVGRLVDVDADDTDVLVIRYVSLESWVRTLGPESGIAKAVAAGESSFHGDTSLLPHLVRALTALAPPTRPQ